MGVGVMDDTELRAGRVATLRALAELVRRNWIGFPCVLGVPVIGVVGGGVASWACTAAEEIVKGATAPSPCELPRMSG